MAFPNTLFLDYGQEKRVSTLKAHPLGTRGVTPDGRVFYYALANGAIRAGVLCERHAALATGYSFDVAVGSAAASAAQSIYLVSLSTTAITKDQFADGYLGINDGPSEGHSYKILSHLANALGSTVRVNLYPNDKVQEALSTSSLVSLAYSDYFDVNESSAASANGRTDVIVGVAPVEVADNQYFWCQTWGHAHVLVTGVAVIGHFMGLATIDGAAGPETVGAVSSALLEQTLGIWANPIATATDYGKCVLAIRP